MIDNNKVILRLGNRQGSLPIIKSLASASHILLHVAAATPQSQVCDAFARMPAKFGRATR